MIDFSTLQSLTIPEGVVVQINNGDVVYWCAGGGPIVLEVSKITSDTYAGETTYTNEKFILLDIYPKSGGTVSVTYGELTKTIVDDGTSENPNAQSVFFGTFNGVSDSVETPDSSKLTISGDCDAFTTGTYKSGSKGASEHCSCITEIMKWGSVTYIADYAFYGCTGLTNVTIQPGITTIGDSAFQSCTSLTSITIPPSVTTIDSLAISSCRSLHSVTVPPSVTTIGTKAFALSDSLVSINIPSGVTTIGDDVFSGCAELKTLYWYSEVIITGVILGQAPKLTNFIFSNDDPNHMSESGIVFSKNKRVLRAYPSVSGEYVIPDGVTTIGIGAFYRCAGLTNVTITSGITTIGSNAFYGCTGLTNVTIPSSVIAIGNGAFSHCDKITSLNVLATTPPTLGDAFVFESTQISSITVPAGCADAYKMADRWNIHADKIVEAS